MRDHEMRGLLGPAYDDTTDEQRDQIARAAAVIDDRYPDPDLADSRTEALSAAIQVILGDSTDTAEVAAWHRAKAAERDAHARMTGAIIASAGTESEVAHAARLGLTRVTLRKALGR